MNDFIEKKTDTHPNAIAGAVRVRVCFIGYAAIADTKREKKYEGQAKSNVRKCGKQMEKARGKQRYAASLQTSVKAA